MKKYDASSIKNIALLSHGGVGKTSLLEAISFTAKATPKLGKVDDGSSHFDTRADEKERRMTISMSLSSVEWDNCKVNFLDTPGFLDLLGDARAACHVVETAAILVDANSGIQVGTELVSRLVKSENVPAKMFFINGMNKENADFDRVVEELKDAYGTSVAPLQIPIGSGASFKGVIDLITKSAYEYNAGGDGKGKKIDIPADLSDAVEIARAALMESIAESDETLMETYFEAGELSDAEMEAGLSKGVASGLVSPLLCGSANDNMGTDLLLTAASHLCPSADTRTEIALGNEEMLECSASGKTAAFVFKTTSEEHVGEFNMIRVFSGSVKNGLDMKNTVHEGAERVGNVNFVQGNKKVDTDEIPFGDIGGLLKMKHTHTNDTLTDKDSDIVVAPIVFDEPLSRIAITSGEQGDDDKVSDGLKKLNEEDPTFSFKFHSDIHQSILSTRGDHHTEIILNNLEKRFKVTVKKEDPKISYRETVTKPVKYVEYTHKKQSGGAGQYARVFIDMEPATRGEGYEFVDKIVGGVIDAPLRPSVDKGIKAKLVEGVIAGYPIVDVKVSLVDGKTHPVDSKDVAFQIAGKKVFEKAFEMANPILLEPIVDVVVTVPEEYMGDVMGDLSSRRGKISGMEPDGKFQTIKAKVPEAEVDKYSTVLRSLTQGRGMYSRTFSHYDPVPNDVAQKVIAESPKRGEED